MHKFLVVSFLAVLASCNSKQTQHQAVETENFVDYKKQGDSISLLAFSALSGTLKSVIDTAGFEKAIEFCSMDALNLTNQTAKESGTKIMRIANKYRNPLNKAVGKDLEILEKFAPQMPLSGNTESFVFEEEESIVYYKAIYTQALCLNCHGKVGETVSTRFNDFIKTIYPNDLAVGFEEAELRGAWKISFPKKQ